MKYRKLGIGILLILGTALTIGAITTHTTPVSAVATNENCDPGIPYNKCHPGPTSPNPHPLPTSELPLLPSVPSSTIVDSATEFLPSAQINALQNQYGVLQIFRLGNTWLILGSGQEAIGTTTPPPTAPGGPLVAVDTCSASATACLNPASPHQLSAFTTVPLPDNNTIISLEDTFSSNLVTIGDGSQFGPIVLDLINLKWYSSTTVTNIGTLANDTSAYTPLTITPSPQLGIDLP